MDDCLTDEVGLRGRKSGNFSILDHTVEQRIHVLPNVVHDIAVIYLSHLESGRLCAPLQILNADLISNTGMREALVPKQPQQFGQGVPALSSSIHDIFLRDGLHQIFVLLLSQQNVF